MSCVGWWCAGFLDLFFHALFFLFFFDPTSTPPPCPCSPIE